MTIWKTPDQQPEDGNEILFMIGENHCVGYYDEQYWLYVEPKRFYNTEYAPDEIDRWIYVDDLIAQADKAERLQKAVDLAVDILQKAGTTRELTVKGIYVNAISLDELHSVLKEIKQLTKG